MNLRLLIFGALALVSILPVAILGYWQYQTVVDNSTYFTDSFSELVITIAVPGIIAALVLSWWLAGIIVKPLRELEKTAKSIAEGDFSPRVPSSIKYKPRELRDLENSFDQMIEQLDKDITEIENTRELAENASRSKSKFLFAMSHELRVPLNSILDFSQVLSSASNGPLTDEQASLVKNITSSGQHLSKLVSQILDLAQIDEGELDFTLDAINPAEVIDECLNITATIAEKRSISIANNTLAKNLPIIEADAARLKQVILNLLSNAVKFSHVGGTVTINSAVTTNRMLRISIIDTGPGIPKAEYEKIFAPFERLDTKEGNLEGTGIGLTISKQLVESMGGNIGFESELGKGSTFWVSLPIMEETEQPEAPDTGPDNQQQQVDSPAASGRMKRVIYIEDNHLNTQLMEVIFDSVPNAELSLAMTGEEGVKLANEISPDLIIMDIFLPGMDGIEASRLLKDSSRTMDIPIIAISAATWDVDVDRARDAGFFAYLTKPIDIPETLSTIQKALNQ